MACRACDVSAFKAELHLQSGTRCFGPEHRTAKQGLSARAGYLHQSQQQEARKRLAEGETQRSIARSYNVSQGTISRLTA
jgi:DNA-binding NarL/FixJ family response regulator